MNDDLDKLGTGGGGTFWDKHSIRDTTPEHPDSSAGLRARQAAVVSAAQDAEPAAESGNVHGLQGAMPATSGVHRAQAARNRQARIAQGKPLYNKKQQFIGNKPPEEDE